MDTKIGYVNASCYECGETYNGYDFHTCPLSLDRTQETVLRAVTKWTAQFIERPHVKVDAELYDAVLAYERSLAAEPQRKAAKTRLHSLLKPAIVAAKAKIKAENRKQKGK